MYLGKPVIATNYSGNTDYMSVNNSFLVKYRLKELERDFGLYKKGNSWAEPDVEDAAMWMRYVFENREAAQEIGARAAQSIRQQLSPNEIGRLIRTRIDEIVELSE
jgi:glycosyltransferase involved in cell wall biosynthesis